MNEPITLSRAAFTRLLDAALSKPDPDDPDGPSGPWGPIGPILRAVDRLESVLLNPQPLPPRDWLRDLDRGDPDRWRFGGRRTGPSPHSGGLAHAARELIQEAVAHHRWAVARSGENDEGEATRRITRQIHDMVEEWCGTPPGPRWPFPWPPPFEEPGPLDLLRAGAQFHHAVEALEGHALREAFDGAASRLFEAGLEGFEDGGGTDGRAGGGEEAGESAGGDAGEGTRPPWAKAPDNEGTSRGEEEGEGEGEDR